MGFGCPSRPGPVSSRRDDSRTEGPALGPPLFRLLVPGTRGRACRPLRTDRSHRTSPLGWIRELLERHPLRPVHLVLCTLPDGDAGRLPSQRPGPAETGPAPKLQGAGLLVAERPGLPLTGDEHPGNRPLRTSNPYRMTHAGCQPESGGGFRVRAAARPRKPARACSLGRKQALAVDHLMILVTRPAPTVRPPSRIAKRRPSSIAIGWISCTVISTLSPGMTISVPSGRVTTPVTSVVRK